MDADFASSPVSVLATLQRPPAGVWRQAWHRFRRNRAGMIGLVLVTLVVLTAIIGPFVAPYDPNDNAAMLRGASNAAPSARNWLGTDRNGYDVLSRTIYGAPTALAVGLGAMLIASLIGVLVGGVAGYVGGFTDEALMRGAEFFMVVPVFVVILAVVRLFGIIVVGTPLERIPNFNLMTIILLLGLFSWPQIARMTRAEFLRLRHAEFVEAARCIGTTPREILFRHILPNALPPLIVLVALGIGGAILAEAMVSFLGFGDPKSISWGQILFFNYQSLKVAPWACLAPGTAIFVTVLGFNLLADGLTDAFNPRVRA
ncbi:ABC transporter permease [Reyranella soli]|uniref:Peptide ABC transporter permease n=1 Tax=Reyranella soli TaxID=1230389 RepID=A0A512NDZ9_9HYPH|nr:ABC transporter permease [Reyranella soli]GEP57171.1 peptide ABC transporter permease [Reyranella soli]